MRWRPLRARPQPGGRADVQGRHGCLRDAVPRLIKDPRDRGARTQALYARLVLLDCARLCLDGAASQAGACLRRLFRHAACRNPCRSCCPTRPPSTKRPVPDLLARSPRHSAVARRVAGSGISRSPLGSPLSLKEIGISEADLDRAAAIAIEKYLCESTARRPGIDKGTPSGGLGGTPSGGLRIKQEGGVNT